MKGGYLGKILYVNLDNKQTEDVKLPDEFLKKYLGGKGFGARLLYELVDEEVDPLSPNNVLIFMSGPLTGTAVPAMRGVVVTKSPLTGTITDSYYGGHLSHEINYAGYDGIVIKGKASSPVMLYIGSEGVEIKDASDLWGLDTYQTYDEIKNKLYNKRVKIACIGPAGENLVKFACIDCDPHRQAGRGGTGTVMGSKNLKAIIVKGNYQVPIDNKKGFMELLSKVHSEFPSHGNNHTKVGTAGTLEFGNSQGFFPFRNFQDGFMENAVEKIGAEPQEKEFWLKDFGCSACIIRCGKLGKLQKGKYKNTKGDITEYETLGLLGGNLDIDKIDTITYLGNLCDKMGMDTISTGGVLGFAIECYKNGVLDSKDTGGLELDFGKADETIELIKNIAQRKDLGDLLAEGTRAAAKELDQEALYYAMQVKGFEIPAWAPRGTNSMALAYMTNDRGASHMQAFGIGTELENGEYPGGQVKHLDPKGIGPFVAWLQNTTAASYSLVQCAFGRNVINDELALKFMKLITGWNITKEEYEKAGERIWNITRLFNLREGFTRDDDDLPRRFKEEPLPSGPNKGHKITEEDRNIMLDEYYESRGWDKQGIPRKDILQKLDLLELDKEKVF